MRGIVVLKNTINGDDLNEKSILDGRFHSYKLSAKNG